MLCMPVCIGSLPHAVSGKVSDSAINTFIQAFFTLYYFVVFSGHTALFQDKTPDRCAKKRTLLF